MIFLKAILILLNFNFIIGSGKQMLFYHLNNEQSLYVIDKLNKITLLSNNELSVETLNDKISSDDSSMPKLYSLLNVNKNYILIGTRHKLINISLENGLDSARVLSWPQSLNTKTIKSLNNNNKYECLTSKFSFYLCDNYIRTAVPLIDNYDESFKQIIICGTNSSQPYCRKYALNYNGSDYYTLVDEFQTPQMLTLNRITSKSNLIPAFSSSRSDAIYFVNLGSFSQETTINKQILNKKSQFTKIVKTPKFALKNPNFKSSFEYKDKVFFFYSEIDLNDETNGLTFKTPYSFIAEVCADDNGRSSFNEIDNRFITFKKANIYCYLPDYRDEFHLKYTEIQAVSKPLKRASNSNEDDQVFYATFIFRRANSIDSALCKYKLSTVESVMKGYFKSMEHQQRDTIIYRKPLDSCLKYKDLNEPVLNEYYREMIKNYKFEMDQIINEPAMFALSNIKFNSLVIDEARRDNNHNDVIFIGTDDGRVLKLITQETIINSKKYQQPIIIQEIIVFQVNKSVKNLIIYPKESNLIVISEDEIKSIRLDKTCSSYLTCTQCIISQDPYCVWSTTKSKCVSLKDNLIDNFDGDLSKCYDLTTSTNDSKLDMALFYSSRSEQRENTNQFDTSLLVAIFLTALITCLISVLLTWFFIKKRYQMAEYLAKYLLKTSTASDQSNRSSSLSYNTYSTKQYNDTTQTKCNSYFEKATKSELVKNRYVAPDSPITSTTLTESSNQHSPSQLITRSLNSALSSSDDSIEPSLVDTQKRRFIYSTVDSARLNSDIINITTNLLSCNNNDSNI